MVAVSRGWSMSPRRWTMARRLKPCKLKEFTTAGVGDSINRLVHVAKKVDNENASNTLRVSYMFRNAK